MKFLMSGISGRMGQNISQMAEQNNLGECVYGWALNPTGDRGIRSLEDAKPSEVEIVIDFSLPEAFMQSLSWAEKNGLAFFSGTTGLAKEQFDLLEQASKTIPVLWSPNTSLGVNFLNGLIGSLGGLENFDFQIIESHHSQKKDAPSGTALFLQKTLMNAVKADVPEPLSIRGGGIFGEHEVLAMAQEEVISLKHTALTRSVFAKGALTGARWLVGSKPGLYTMKDVLGF